MTDSSDSDVGERLVDLVAEIDEYVVKFKEAVVEDGDDSDLRELVENILEVLDEIEDVLQTIDFEEIPEAINVEEIPEAIDVEDVPNGLFDEDKNAIKLRSVKEAVNLRKLWAAVDLTELYQEKQELDNEVDELTDQMSGDEDTADGEAEAEAAKAEDGGILDTGIMADSDEDDEDVEGDEDDKLFQNVVGVGDGAHVEFNSQARQAVLEEKIQDAVEKFRGVILATHGKLRKLYRMNQEKLGQPGRQPDSRNPTAASTMPSGPVPASASLRTSTVPSQVRYSRIKNPRRIYAHRFDEETESEEDGETSADGESQDTPEDDEILLEVRDE